MASNLNDIREEIKLNKLYQIKLKDHLHIVKFYHLLLILTEYHRIYKDEDRTDYSPLFEFELNENYLKLIDKESRCLPRNEWNIRFRRKPYQNFSTFEHFIKALPCVLPKSEKYQEPLKYLETSQAKLLLSNWDRITSLYNDLENKIKGAIDAELKKVGISHVEPTILTIIDFFRFEDYSFILKEGNEPIYTKKLSLFPIHNLFKHYGLGGIILGLGILSGIAYLFIYLNRQPSRWIASLVIALIITGVIGGIIYNIITLFLKRNIKRNKWIPYAIGSIGGIVLFFSIYKDYDYYYYEEYLRTYNHTHKTQNQLYGQDDLYPDNDYIEVYTTPTGNCYHSTSQCPSLSRSRTLYTTTKGKAKKELFSLPEMLVIVIWNFSFLNFKFV